MVDDIFPECGHPVKRRCWEELSGLTCQNKVTFVHDSCGHTATKKCYVCPTTLTCSHPCPSKMNCQKHQCPDKCGSPHSHDNCQSAEKFTFPDCGHDGVKKCCEFIDSQTCSSDVVVTLMKCRHEVFKKCHQREDDVICPHPCKEKNNCQKHDCERPCGESHTHAVCDFLIHYKFPICLHHSTKEKKCSEPIIWKCKTVAFDLHPICGHEIRKECWQKPEDVVCGFRPCCKDRDCGHPCVNTCGEDCNKGNCVACEMNHQKMLEKFKHRANIKIREIAQRSQDNPDSVKFQKTEVPRNGKTESEFMDVADKVLKYIQPMHNWFPSIVKIEKVINLELEQKFEEAKLEAFGTHIGQKFHGTGKEGIKKIPKNGFQLPRLPTNSSQRPSMFGQGIYFATDSSKSAQAIYTKGSFKLLLCDVLIGNSMTVTAADSSLCKEKLKQEQADSVYAIRNSKATGGVENDEYVVFDPRQAIVRYIIEFAMANVSDRSNAKSLAALAETSNKKFLLKNVKSSRKFDMNDPYDSHYRNAESHYLRMAKRLGNRQKEIESIDIVYNEDLQKLFNKKKIEFKKSDIKDDEVLAFHGTKKENVENILKENLQMSYAKRQLHGPGNYFSEFPDTRYQFA